MQFKFSHLNLPAIGLIAALLGAPDTQAQNWTSVGAEGFSPGASGSASWQKIKINRNNVPYVSFTDAGIGTNGSGAVMKFNGTNWEHLGASGFTSGEATNSNFIFGNGDTVYFSYANAGQSSTASVMMYDGNSWSSIGNNLSQGAAVYTCMAFTPDGKLYLGMIDMGQNDGALVVKQYTGGSTWQNVGTGPLSSATAGHADMTTDNNGIVHVAYRDDSEAPGKLRVKKLTGTTWTNVGQPTLAITGMGAGSIMYSSLAFDSHNTPYVSYCHTFMGPPKVSVEKFDGTSWTVVGTPQFSNPGTGMALFSALAIHDTIPYVVFQNGDQNNKATVKKYDAASNSWSDVQGTAVSTAGTAYSSITTDANGNVFVAYLDEANNNKNTVRRLTLCAAPEANAIVATDTPICNGPATLSINGNLNDATAWNWYTGNCDNGTVVGTGTSLQVDPTVATTYFVKGVGGCVAVSNCNTITVNVNLTKPTATASGNVLTSSANTGNQWYRNGSAISGATGSTYTADNSGWYYTTVTNGNCSRSSDSVYVAPTSIGAANLDKFINIYPTHFRNTINIELDAQLALNEGWEVVVVDYMGRTLVQQAIEQHQSTLNLGNVAAGMYLVKVCNAKNSSAHFKIVKQ
ncbi:MAG: T9SS type A sorting domain-containing protein [Taibaiella sp.]|nr:T9SS type A sorting domain-containing protein [Taibaiella sp.]